MRKFWTLICGLIFMVLTTSCLRSGSDDVPVTSAGDAFDLLNNEGMSCRAMDALHSLSDTERKALSSMLRAKFTQEAIERMIDTRASDCQDGAPSEKKPDMQSITSMYQVEPIEEKSGSGGVPASSVYVDSASSYWMCNSGAPGHWYNPGDYIGKYHINGAYANRFFLKVQGSNFYSNCYIHGAHAARVYTDDDILMCIGYWSVLLCGAIMPLPGETFVWLE